MNRNNKHKLLWRMFRFSSRKVCRSRVIRGMMIMIKDRIVMGNKLTPKKHKQTLKHLLVKIRQILQQNLSRLVSNSR